MAGRIPKVVVVAPSYIDMVIKCEQCPQPGQTVEGTGLSYSLTGAGPNRAIEAALCGCESYLLSKIGDDLFGQLVKDNLQKHNVNTNYIYTAQAMTTGMILTMVDSLGENSSCISPGANRALGSDELSCASAEQLIGSADVCLVDGHLPSEAVTSAIRTANLHKTNVILETELDIRDSADACNIDLPREFYSVNVLIPDLHTCAVAADFRAGNVHNLKLIACELVARGIECVVIKMGTRGSFVVNRSGTSHIEGFDVELVDHDGCADAFAGALAAAWGAGDPPDKAVHFAGAAGALACTKFGAQDSLPTKEEILGMLLE